MLMRSSVPRAKNSWRASSEELEIFSFQICSTRWGIYFVAILLVLQKRIYRSPDPIYAIPAYVGSARVALILLWHMHIIENVSYKTPALMQQMHQPIMGLWIETKGPDPVR
jgi:hypothetical protein